MTSFAKTVRTVFIKEMWEHFKTKRLIIIGIVFAVLFIALSLYGGILSGTGNADATYKEGPNTVLSTVLSFTGMFPPIMAIIIAYTSIVGERAKKSLILMLSKPVRRPALFLGKFLSSFVAITLVYLVVMTAGYIGVIGVSGIIPSAEDVGRAYGAVAFVLFGMACWVSFTMFLSTALKNQMLVAISALLIWLMILPLVSSAGMIYYMVSNLDTGAREPAKNVDIAVFAQDDGNSTVGLSGTYFYMYSIKNDAGVPSQGFLMNGAFTATSLKEGNYTWYASGLDVNRTGKIYVDGMHPFSVSTRSGILVTAMSGTNVSLTEGETLIAPSNVTQKGPVAMYQYTPNNGNYRLTLSDENHTYFEGNYEIKNRNRSGMAVVTSEGEVSQGELKMPDYVKYNQLVNPDNAVTGYQQVLDPDATTMFTPAEGASALAIFFTGFFVLGLLLFWKMELV